MITLLTIVLVVLHCVSRLKTIAKIANPFFVSRKRLKLIKRKIKTSLGQVVRSRSPAIRETATKRHAEVGRRTAGFGNHRSPL